MIPISMNRRGLSLWTIELMVVGLALAAGGCKTEEEPCESPHRMSRKDMETLKKIVDAEEPNLSEWFKWPEKEDEDYYHTHQRVIDSFGRGFGIFSVSLESPFEHYNGPYGYHFVFDYRVKLFGHFPGGTGRDFGLGLPLLPRDINRDGLIECVTTYYRPEGDRQTSPDKSQQLTVWQLRRGGLAKLLSVVFSNIIIDKNTGLGESVFATVSDEGVISLGGIEPQKPLVQFRWDDAGNRYTGPLGGADKPWQMLSHKPVMAKDETFDEE